MPWDAILRLLERARMLNAVTPDHFLFPFKISRGMGYDPSKPTKGWRSAWRKLTKAAGLSGLRFHDLRHTFITGHAEIGTPLSVVMAQVGHLSARMTKEYTLISQRAKQEAAEQYRRKKAEAMARAKKALAAGSA